MTLPEAIEILSLANKWRRGAEIPMPDPTQLGIAIDTVIEHYKTKPIRKDDQDRVEPIGFIL